MREQEPCESGVVATAQGQPPFTAASPSTTIPRIELVLRLILGGLFLYSGGIKLLDPAAFQVEIANFELIPLGLAGAVAVYLPWLELLCGAALAANRKADGGVFILGLLMLAFIFFVGSAWARGLDVRCGCFGFSDSAPNYPLWIARNLLILAGLATIGWLRWKKLPCSTPRSTVPTSI